MEVTEVRIHLLRESGRENEKLRAFATVTFDNAFVVREVKVIDGDSGLFVAMPSRKAMERCHQCGTRNVVQSAYCNGCGGRLSKHVPDHLKDKIYLDVAHPVNSACRKMVHEAVISEYQRELQSAQPEKEGQATNR